eukprot:m.431305 g.431305  ORF g.431305 m.431305 type:complete len:306 (-) comp21400_c1_seq1:433-1350(-)
MPKRFEVGLLAVILATAFINKVRVCNYENGDDMARRSCLAESLGNTEQKQGIEIVSLNVGDQPWCRCTDQNHREYATQHGYRYTRYTQKHPNATDDVKFSKYNYVMDHMRYSDSSYILLVDCDIVFTNMSVRVSDIWSKWAQKNTELILARDPLWYLPFGESFGFKTWRINTGAILYRSSDWNFRLLCESASKGAVQNCPLRDQTRTELELIQRNQIHSHPFSEHESMDKVSIVSQRVMNSFYYSDRPAYHYYSLLHSAAVRWRSGDWMAHILGASGSTDQFRVNAMKRFGLCSHPSSRKESHVS